MPSMKQSELETRDVKRLLLVAAAVLLLLTLSLGCKKERELNADLWSINPDDSTLYRVIQRPGEEEREQFYSIPGNPEMKKFACMVDSDRKKWLKYMEQNCN